MNGRRACSNKAQSGSPFFDLFYEHLGPYIDKNAANVDFQVYSVSGLSA